MNGKNIQSKNTSNIPQSINQKPKWKFMLYLPYFVLTFLLMYGISYLNGNDDFHSFLILLILFIIFILIFMGYCIVGKYFTKTEQKVTPYLLYSLFLLTTLAFSLLNKIRFIPEEGGFISLDFSSFFAYIIWVQFFFTSIIYYLIKKRISKERITNSVHLYTFLVSIFFGSIVAVIFTSLFYYKI